MTGFAAIETATAANAVAALANCTATIGAVSGVPGIFDDAYTDQLGISGSTPALLCASTDVASAAYGASVTIGAVSYTVHAIQPDGIGMTRLLLQES